MTHKGIWQIGLFLNTACNWKLNTVCYLAEVLNSINYLQVTSARKKRGSIKAMRHCLGHCCFVIRIQSELSEVAIGQLSRNETEKLTLSQEVGIAMEKYRSNEYWLIGRRTSLQRFVDIRCRRHVQSAKIISLVEWQDTADRWVETETPYVAVLSINTQYYSWCLVDWYLEGLCKRICTC